MQKLSGHIPALDGIRGAAILMVLLNHFNNEAVLIEHFSIVGALISKVFIAGGVGVDLFFILSGFLITGILLGTKDRERYFVNFYMRRALRIFPLPVFWEYFGMDKLISLVSNPIVGVLLHLLVAIGASFFIAWISWHVFEKKILWFKKYFYTIPPHKTEVHAV